MIVAYNALSVRPGVFDGAATFSLNLVARLPDALPAARVVAFVQPGETRLPRHPRLDVRELPVHAGAPARLAVELLRLPVALRRAGADLLLSPNESIPLAPPCPTVVVAQNLVYHREDWPSAFQGSSRRERLTSQVQAAYYRTRMQRAYRRAAAVVAVSRETARVLAARAGLDPSKTEVVLEGSDSFLLPEPRGGDEREPRLLVVSALSPYKNHERAIDVLAALRADGHDVVLEIVGSDWRGYRAVLERHAAARRVADAVRFLGQVDADDLARLYSRSLLLLHLSSCESFGLPVLEAMRYGLPVVAADRSSLPEVAGAAAALVDPDDVAGTAAAVRALASSAAERTRLAELGRARAAELTWRKTAEGVAAVVVRELRGAAGGHRHAADRPR